MSNTIFIEVKTEHEQDGLMFLDTRATCSLNYQKLLLLLLLLKFNLVL